MKTKKTKDDFEFYSDKKDAFLSGYAEGLEDAIDTLVWLGAFTDDFLFERIKDFVVKMKNTRKWKPLI